MSKHYIVNKNDKYQLKVRVKRNNISGNYYPLKITIVTEFAGDVFEEELDNTNLMTSYEERTYEFNVDFRSSSLTIRIEGITNYGSASIDYAYLSIYRQQFQTTVLTPLVLEGSDMDTLTGWTTTGNVFIGVSGNDIFIHRAGKIEKTITFKNYSINTVLLQNGIVDYYSLTRSYTDTDINSITRNILYNYYSINNFIFVYPSELLFLIDGNTANNFDFNESSITPTNTILGQSPQQITVIGKWLSSATISPISVIATDVTNATNKYTFLNLDIQKANQDSFDLSGVLSSYSYGTDITFDSSGGSGTGTVNYTVIHPIFGSITVLGDTITQDISANIEPYKVVGTKLGDENYNDISASELFTVQKTNQHKSPVENFLLEIIAVEQFNADLEPNVVNVLINEVIVGSNDVIVGSLDFTEDFVWKKFTFNVSLDITSTEMEIKIQNIRQDARGTFIDSVKLFYQDPINGDKQLIANPGMLVYDIPATNPDNQDDPNWNPYFLFLEWNTQYGSWFMGPATGQVKNYSRTSNYTGTNDGDGNNLYFTQYGYFKQTLTFTRNITYDNINNKYDVSTTVTNNSISYPEKVSTTITTGTFDYNLPVIDQSPQISLFTSSLLEKYKLSFQARARTDSNGIGAGNTTDIYYSLSNAFVISVPTSVKLDTIIPSNSVWTEYVYIIYLPPVFDYFSIRFQNTVGGQFSNCFTDIKLEAYDPVSDVNTGINLMSDSQTQLGTSGLPVGTWNVLLNFFNYDSWYAVGVRHEHNSIQEKVTRNRETLSIVGRGYLIQELLVSRTFDYVSNTITTTFKNKNTNAITNSYSYSHVPEYQYDNRPETTYVLSSGGSGSGAISYSGDLTVTNNTLESLDPYNVGSYTISAVKDGGDYYNDSSTNFNVVISPVSQDPPITVTGVDISYNYGDPVFFAYSGGSGSGNITITLNGESTINGNVITSPIENLDANDYDLVVTKGASGNYDTSSFTASFSINKIDQALLFFSSINSSYYYLDPITFATTGGSGTGLVTFTLSGDSVESPLTDVSAGEYTLIATKDGGQNYNDISINTTITINKIDQDPLFLSNIKTSYTYGNTITFDIIGSQIGDLEYYLNSSIYNGDFTDLNVGVYNLQVKSLGNNNYNANETTVYNFTVIKAKLTSLIVNLGTTEQNTSSTNRSFNVGNNIYFNISGGLTIDNNVLNTNIDVYLNDGTTSISSPINNIQKGSYTLTVVKSGNTEYNSVSSTIDFSVGLSFQNSLVVSNVSAEYQYGETITPTISGGSGTGDEYFIINEDRLNKYYSFVTNLSVGQYTLTAIKEETIEYAIATSSVSFTVIKINQPSLSFSNSTNYTYLSPITLGVAGGGGTGTVLFKINDKYTTPELPLLSVGTYTIEAIKEADTNYKEASISGELIINKINQPDFQILNTEMDFLQSSTQFIELLFSGGRENANDEDYEIKVNGSIKNERIISIYYTGEYVVEVKLLGGNNYNDISDTYTYSVIDRPQFSVFTSKLETYRLIIKAKRSEENVDDANTTEIYYNSSDVSEIENRVLIGSLVPDYTEVSTHIYDFTVKPNSDYFALELINTIQDSTSNAIDHMEMYLLDPNTMQPIDGHNLIGTPDMNLNDTDNGKFDIIYSNNPLKKSWTAVSLVVSDYNSPEYGFSINSETAILISTAYLYQELYINRLYNDQTNEITVEFINVNTNEITGSPSYTSAQTYDYLEDIYVVPYGGVDNGVITYNTPLIVDREFSYIEAGTYTFNAEKDAGDIFYGVVDYDFTFTINKIDQSNNLNIIGLKDEYEYNEDIILDTTGGNGNGIVEYTFTNQNTNVITKLTNGENTYNELDSADYIVQAEKLGDQNYNSTVSPEVSFIVFKKRQAAINITNVNNSYPYLEPIYFSLTGGSSTGDAIFTLSEAYTVKVVQNWAGDNVFSIKAPGENLYYNQPVLSFNAGDSAFFDVGHSSMTGYTLVFGTEIDNSGTILGSPYVSQTGTLINLNLPSDYTGGAVYYFENTNVGMGYVEEPITTTIDTIIDPPLSKRGYNDIYPHSIYEDSRLASSVGWAGKTLDGQNYTDYIYIGNETDGDITIIGVKIMTRADGTPFGAQGVTTFTAKYSSDNITYYDVDGGSTFYTNFSSTANPHEDQESLNYFATPVTAQYIRITPTSHYGWVSMRAGLIQRTTTTINTYPVTVSNGVFYIDTGSGSQSKPNVNFTDGETYIFDQSDSTNANNTLVIGTTFDDPTSIVSSGLTIMGTPGQPGAYTKYVADGSTVYYISYQTENMGLAPPNITDDLYVQRLVTSPLENLLVGSYRLECTKLGDVNYKDISTFVDFSVTKIDQTTQLIITSETGGTFFRYSQTSLTAIVSGGNGDGAITFSSTPPVEMSGNTVSLFTDVGIYYITATKAGDRNYNSTQSGSFGFQIQKIRQDALFIENDTESYVYDPELSIVFNDYITGGSGTGAISVYLYNNGQVLENNTLNEPNVGAYNIKVIKEEDGNYFQETVDGTIYVTKAEQNQIEILTGDTFTYGDEIDLSGYSTTVTNGVFTFSYNGATLDNLTGFDVGTYTIVATNTGGINYFDKSGEKTIEIIKAEQSDDFEITTSNLFTYNPSLRIVFDASGGSGNGPITYELELDFNQDDNTTVIEGLEYIDGAEVGVYKLTATRDGGKNYHNKTVSRSFTVVQADQDFLYELNNSSYVYDPNQRIYFDVSGGSTNKPVTYQYQYYYNDENSPIVFQEYLDSPEVGDYSITATKDGNRNYKQIVYTYNIEITKAEQAPITVTPTTVDYLLQRGSVQLDISGGSTDSDLKLKFADDENVSIDDNNLVTFSRPGKITIEAEKQGNKNYKKLNVTLTFEVIINIQVLREMGYRPRDLVNDPYIELKDIKDSYSVVELVNNAISGIDQTVDKLNGFTVREMFLGEISACAIFDSRLFTVLDLKRAGFKMRICVKS